MLSQYLSTLARMIEAIPERPKTRERRYNNYTIGIAISFLAGIGLSLALLLTAHLAFGTMPEWLLQLLYALFGIISVSQIVSGTGYTVTGGDIAFNRKTVVQAVKFMYKKKYTGKKFVEFMQERKIEFVGLILGLAFSIALTVVLVVEKVGDVLDPFVKGIPVVGNIIFFLTNVSMISGLFSRLGRCTDYVRANSGPNFFRGENVNYSLAVVAGALIGILIAGLLLGLVGVTSAMSGGGLLPAWASIILFGFNIFSTSASACGYIGRVFDFLFGDRTLLGLFRDLKLGVSPDPTKNKGIKGRVNAERVGTLIGIGVGTIFAFVLIGVAIGLGLATIPVFGFGLPIAAASVIVLLTFISGLGGLGNRLGQWVDTAKRKGGDGEHAKREVEADVTSKKYRGPDRDSIFDPLLKSHDSEQSASFNYEAPVQPAVEASAKKIVFKIGVLAGGAENTENRENGENSYAENIDSGRRSADTGNVEVSTISSGIPRMGSTRCEFFTTTSRETISGSDSAGLDVAGDKWTYLRQKAESGKVDATYSHHHDYRTCRRREQIEGIGSGSRRLCH